MKIYRIDDQIVFADKELSVGELLTPNILINRCLNRSGRIDVAGRRFHI